MVELISKTLHVVGTASECSAMIRVHPRNSECERNVHADCLINSVNDYVIKVYDCLISFGGAYRIRSASTSCAPVAPNSKA